MQGREHFKVKLNGVGIHCGKGVIVDKLSVLHGDTYNTAYHIGEDMCDGGSVMISNAVRQVIQNQADFASASYEPVGLEAGDEMDEPVFELKGTIANKNYEMVPTTHDTYLHQSLMKLAQRHDPKTNLNALDGLLKTNYLRNYTVLMYEFELAEIEKAKGGEAGMNLKFQALSIVEPAI
jgi:hypothetical protein